MSRKIQVTIPEPCHEDWQQMKPSEKGRFCDSCQKQVVDFTGMSDAQLIAFFKKPSSGSACGRFLNDQLDRDLQVPRKRMPWVKYFFQLLLPAFLMSTRAQSQGSPKLTDSVQVKESPPLPGFGIATPKKQQPVKTKKKPYPLNNICEEDDTSGVLKKPMPDVGDLVPVSFEHQRARIASGEMRFTPADEFLGRMGGFAMAYTEKPSSKKRKEIQLIGGNFGDTTSHHFNLFPNPAPSGSKLKIELKQKLKQGYFTLELLSAAGASVYRKEIWIDGEARLVDVDIPLLSPGNYFLSLVSKENGTKHSEPLIITSAR